ncbi:hypothetical protein [Lacticaseibacillus parakribbianus]|uniref:hypothetical protein n=1 Tax=Lacticaseibacillus parakribbianus TaxID=2970927 RepID=UPI0021CB84BF|nr:hypothetical protein [Lacticaseibacillus parakribbianus]
MKKLIAPVLLTALAGVALATVNPVAAAETTGTTTGTINFKAGDLSLTNVTETANFGSDLTVEGVWTKGFNEAADNTLTATVTDFQGLDNDNWMLSVKAAGWVAGSDGSAAGAAILNANATLTATQGDAQDATSANLADGFLIASGTTGETPVKDTTVTLDIPKETAIKAGSYTNALNWNLTAAASTTQD